jgi:hypothetical protein
MKGGFLDDLSNTLSGWGTSISDGASNLWQKTKDATSSLTGSTDTSSTSYFPTTTTTSTYGGKHRKSRRHMKGGYHDNTPTTGLAAHAAPFSGPTAQPHNWVGGKTKRRNKKGGKSRRHRKH